MASSAKILVVDDERNNLELCARQLNRSGYLVDLALSGPQAMEMAQKAHYDVVLLDYMMPGMSGVDVLKALRLRHDPLELAIIMVTAVSESSKISEALDLGANDYITKPIDFNVALARIRSQVANIRKGTTIRVTEERYALAAEGARTGLWDWDLEHDEVYFCSRWKSLLGYAAEDLSSQPDDWFSRVHPSDVERLKSIIQAHLGNAAAELQCDYRIQGKDGTYRWMSLHGAAVRHGDGRAYRLVGSQSDITNQATVDFLTELPNRVSFVDRLSAALAHRRSDPNWHFAVLFLNLDRFKLFNDSLGNATGDRMLAAVARRLRNSLNASIKEICPDAEAFIARLRGDEFAVLVENLGGTSTAEALANSVSEIMRPVFHENGQEFYCTFSVGIAFPQANRMSEEDLLRNADIAMCVAKARGQGKWAVFDVSMQQERTNRLQLDNDLRKAIQESQFEVYYQPIVLLETGAIRGFEALVRWNHPNHGLVFPGAFIPVAEQTGLIDEIGLWVLGEACRQVQSWNQERPDLTPYYAAVNLSARQCEDPRLIEHVSAVLEATGLLPECLHLELTESMVCEEMTETCKMLEALKRLQIGLKIDDFGTGYSSLQHLAKLPFDMLKIDRSFVRDMNAESPESIELVRSILMMAKGLNMEGIAEGIEEIEQSRLLDQMGCSFGQGYFFSKPVPAREIETMLAAGPGASCALPRSASCVLASGH